MKFEIATVDSINHKICGLHQSQDHGWIVSRRRVTGRDRPLLDKLGITHILTVANMPYLAYDPRYTHMAIQADDTPIYDIYSHLDAACEFIDAAIKADKSVLVHCAAGVSRSATVVVAYVMK